MEKNNKITFKSIIVSPIIRPDQDYTRRELWHLKQEIKKVLSKYGTASCTYYSRFVESTMHGYNENYAIVDFKRKNQAKKALKAVENGEVYINKIKVTAKVIELYKTPIQKLPNECLLEIFKHLSVYDQLKLQKVCRRWKKVSEPFWKNVTKIDLRKKDNHLRDENYIINSGIHLKDIYCYDDHGLKVIGKHCPNVENVAIEFRKYTKRKELDRACIKFEIQILLKFSHLTRLMLRIRNDQYTYFDFLRHLPETMIEIHLLNDIELRDYRRYNWGPKIGVNYLNYGKKSFNFSRFSQLQALTLKAYIFDESSLVGLEKLKKLTCLRLDDCIFSQACVHQLKCFTNLVHLSLRHVELHYHDVWPLLVRNKDLQYLALPLMADICRREDMWARALELRKLKTLCWSNMDLKMRETGASVNIENMELDYVSLSDRRFLLLLDSFPNLRIVKRTNWYGPSYYLLTRLRTVILDRPNKSSFKYIPGKIPHEWHLMHPNDSKEHFQYFENPSPGDAKLFRCDMWNGWYIDDDSLKSTHIEKSCSTSSLENHPHSNVNIDQLSNEHLVKIFSYLSIDDKSKVSEVCKRWQKIVNEHSESFMKFDVRQLSNHSNRSQCLLQYGKHFKDVYCYKSCGFLALKKHCPNIKNLAVDFGVKRCDCETISKEFYSVKSLGIMLNSFKHLTRLMIKDVTAFCSNIFDYFPETLEELHVFNRNPGKISIEQKEESTEVERRKISIDLSRLKNLRALTLVQANLPADGLCDESVGVIGLENMKNLVHLRLSGDISIVNSDLLNSLPLEYLSLTQSTIPYGNLPLLVMYDNIQYLDITDSFEEMTNNQLSAILVLLGRLKVFMMAKTCPDFLEDEEPWHFDFIPVLPHLEVLDCHGHCRMLNSLISSVVTSSPNLKIVNMTVMVGNYLEELLATAESARMNGSNNAMLNIFVGTRGLQIANNLRLSAVGVRLMDNPSFEYYKFLGRLFWKGWCIQDGNINIDAICEKLINSFD